jgi:hypothetical protein
MADRKGETANRFDIDEINHGLEKFTGEWPWSANG